MFQTPAKVDRVNYAFFQTNPDGDIWGTDPWADPILLFGPTDWMVTIQPELDYAPQFNDDNGFDDSTGEDFNYVGSKYVDFGPGVFCHRSSPKGKRDCKGHIESQGLISAAHSQGAQVYISIGGWSLSDAFPEVAGNAAARRNFAKNCVGLIREYGIDGIDIDWEFPG
jgi:chitinase